MTLPTRPLGTTGLDITAIGLGAWAIGGGGYLSGWGPQDDEQSLATLRHAVELGMNWIDTAPMYGRGHSEEVIGGFLRTLPEGEWPLVFTKVGPTWSDDPTEGFKSVLRPEIIRRQCEESLRRLGVERIDLLQFHWPDEVGTPVEESWGEMVRLIDEGKVRFGGVSNFGVELLERCEAIRHVDSLQQHFSVVARDLAAKELPWCRDHDTGVLCWSPMESGQLTDSFSKERLESLPGDDFRRRSPRFKEPGLTKNLALRDALRPVGDRHGANVMTIAVAWAIAWAGITGAIVGARRPAQIDEWIGATSLQLSQEDLGEIAAAIERTGAGSGPARP